MITFSILENIRKKNGTVAVALIDPDIKNDESLSNMVNSINKSKFDVIFVGGSLIGDNLFENRINFIKNHTNLPIIIFPGSSNQISIHANAILFLSLISGRNPQYLIGEHVKSAPIIKNINLEVIPTAYMLLDGGSKSSVEIISNTSPLPMNKKDIILAHALAGQYLGNKLLFLESGSGAKNHATLDIVSLLSENLEIPVIVGGGINSPDSAQKLAKAGASYIVLGTKIETNPTINDLLKFTDAIHDN